MTNIHRLQDLQNPQNRQSNAGGGAGTARNFLSNFSDQDVSSSEMIKKCIDYRVPFLCTFYDNSSRFTRH
jgi:hypothetical protein